MKLLCPLILLAACGQEPDSTDTLSREEAEKLAFEASGELMGTLLVELTNAIRAQETHEALDICANVAQEISEKLRKERGVDVRRTALRYRNPKNAPDDFERAWMEKVVASGTMPAEPYTEVVDGELRYLRPLGIAQICTECHGLEENLDPRVKEILARRYPDDHATGFSVGDFRGVVSVRIPLAR